MRNENDDDDADDADFKFDTELNIEMLPSTIKRVLVEYIFISFCM